MSIRYCLFLAVCFLASPVRAETRSGPPDNDKPRDAYVKIINACDTSQAKRWETGLDLKFKNRSIGQDIRMGERGPIAKITFTGKDIIEVYRNGDDSHALASVPALLKKGGIYSLVVMGQIEASSADLNVAVIEEFPLPPESERPGQCRLVLLNAVRSYPVSLSVGNAAPLQLQFGQQKEVFLSPGKIDLGLWFTDSKGNKQRLQAGMIAEPGGNFTAVVHPSEERSDRPALFRFSVVEGRAAIKDTEAVPDSDHSPK